MWAALKIGQERYAAARVGGSALTEDGCGAVNKALTGNDAISNTPYAGTI